jgi:hypothetical protein
MCLLWLKMKNQTEVIILDQVVRRNLQETLTLEARLKESDRSIMGSGLGLAGEPTFKGVPWSDAVLTTHLDIVLFLEG